MYRRLCFFTCFQTCLLCKISYPYKQNNLFYAKMFCNKSITCLTPLLTDPHHSSAIASKNMFSKLLFYYRMIKKYAQSCLVELGS